MSAPRWPEIDGVFQAALDRPEGERAAWVADRCGADDELRQEVESLLAAEARSREFLPRAGLERQISALLEAAAEEPSRAGERVGPYLLRREIGRGGMGVVYLADREDSQFRQRVAVKLVKRGMDTDEVLRRFRNERRILATLNHPNIARIFDGGSTADGLPYFVMEYIDGLPITEYCAGRGLSIADRLRLFRTVLEAVQHAHRNLVIHRDLKPSNILVTPAGEAKLLDFGVAKLLDPELGDDDAMPTMTRFRAMTLEYAGPEQLRGQPASTAADVYSLGVILYEILGGRRPFSFASSSPEQISRIIDESEPPRPSEVAANPRALGRDLDNLVLMAMRKEPERRYPSVEQLAADIDRYLAGLPLVAHRDSLRYRTAKFVGRHKAGIAVAALVIVTVLAGLLATARQGSIARQEQRKAQAVSEFLQRMLRNANPLVNRSGRSSSEVTMADALDAAAALLDGEELAVGPEVRAELERIVGDSYNNLGRYDVAMKHFERYIELEDRGARTTALVDGYRARVLFHRNDLRGAEAVFGRAMPALREEHARGRLGAGPFVEMLLDAATIQRTAGHSREAEALFREALALGDDLQREQRYLLVIAGATLASVVADQGRFEEAFEQAAQTVASCPRGQPECGYAATVFGGLLADSGDHETAGRVLRDGEAVLRATLEPSSLWLGDNLRNQAISLYERGRYADALQAIEQTLQIYSAVTSQYDHYPTALLVRGLSLARLGHVREGERVVLEALRIRRETLPRGHYFTALAEAALGECLLVQGRADEAGPLLRGALEALVAAQGEDNPRTRRVAALLRTAAR